VALQSACRLELWHHHQVLLWCCVTTTCVLNAGRRSSKIVSLLTSCFTATYVRHWATFFPDTPLKQTPMFDGRAVCYPDVQTLRDYLSWRQADTHINNQAGAAREAVRHWSSAEPSRQA
jgi:tRNA(His) guanylyltransferase